MGNTTTYKKKCDGHYPTKVLELGGGVWAGSKYDCKGSFPKFDIILNCTGTASMVPKHKIPYEWGEKFENPVFKEIVLDWDNNQAVLISPDFWSALVKFIVDNNSRVLVCCVGGHGRTGTALTALMLTSGTWKTWDAIDFLRKGYCNEAVETQVQVDYLKDLEVYFKGAK